MNIVLKCYKLLIETRDTETVINHQACREEELQSSPTFEELQSVQVQQLSSPSR